MPTRNRPPRSGRALRPRAEALEDRQLLSTMVTGLDVDGDRWVLRLVGPGALRVTKVDGADLESPTPIETISVTGTAPMFSRLVGRVIPGPEGDGRVFFKHMNQFGGNSLNLPHDNGLLAIDMPDFWLGDTNPDPAAPFGTPAASITIAEGVITLRFGGVDTVTLPPPVGDNNEYLINLGLPAFAGTSILVDRVITSGQIGDEPPAQTIQNSVLFNVQGRLNLFQANAIEGNPEVPATLAAGGTRVNSLPITIAQIPGQIGNVRVGGDATNFVVTTNTRISNFSVGGETEQVFLVAPAGSRNVVFGRGMDRVTIRSHNIETLEANRGALESDVVVEREIARASFGGDVINTRVLSGYFQLAPDPFQVEEPPPTAQIGGGMTALVAGDVINSIFAASVEPFAGVFGSDLDMVIPLGHIHAKVEGRIDNTLSPFVAPQAADQAFFADIVDLVFGPVVPPNVPEPPYPGRGFFDLPARTIGLIASEHFDPLRDPRQGLQPPPQPPGPNGPGDFPGGPLTIPGPGIQSQAQPPRAQRPQVPQPPRPIQGPLASALPAHGSRPTPPPQQGGG